MSETPQLNVSSKGPAGAQVPPGPFSRRGSALLRKIGGRALFYFTTFWVSATLAYLLPHLLPGNPVLLLEERLRTTFTPAAARALEAQYGLNQGSWLHGYVSYFLHLFRFQFGKSITFYPSSVSSVIMSGLPWTLILVGTSTIISFVVGTAAGAALAWKRGTWADAVIPGATLFHAMPYFFLALSMVFVFGWELHLLPQSGGYGLNVQPGWDLAFIGSAIVHSILPAATIIGGSIASWMLSMRNNMITTLGEDYMMLGQAKGLSRRRLLFTYAARNAVLPSVNGFAISLGFVVAGAVLTEEVFSYPGIGYLLFQAATNDDYPLMQGIFITIICAVLVANLIADLVNGLIDPRARIAR